ncbi:hypothetical protein [Candidatus Nitronereus thalassa]|uniref:Glycosyl hydrolase family 76 n=1 Tax=Candidatus Nitronereus thalassa TaxID=3020898 RepID=A0ABU3K8S5_9BACT|nr:hypothetical protein [Candidatus Nitronereus thalassa]MDT7042795.1 hypothetical protein [Candidatus Nitronereus thalassa]
MKQTAPSEEVRDLMIQFAEKTGISTPKTLPKRYLWTDAFAVCNFLTLYRQTGDEEYIRLALNLIDQVHNVLGKHRADDPRTGWISGFSDEERQRHPTAGGLRIGKPLPERGPTDPYDDQSEWDRDGQYFHYLTKWMHALCRTSMVTGNPQYCRWAVELAQAAHDGFRTLPQPDGKKLLYWKMSIDLSYPLVPSMGLHDPLDGLITYHELSLCTQKFTGALTGPDLTWELTDAATMCEGQHWETTDSLGIGGLLCDAYRVVQMTAKGQANMSGLLLALLRASQYGLGVLASHDHLNDPPEYRLAFRELGLSIGLKAIANMRDIVTAHPDLFDYSLAQDLEGLMAHVPLIEIIEDFWRKPTNQHQESWLDHRDINMVMLATSLSPEEFLSV